jgi:predicted amidohydrolase YtcJ
MKKVTTTTLFKQSLLALATMVMLGACADKATTESNTPLNQDQANTEQTLYFGGDIITMQGDTPQYAEAVIERDGKIIYVGDKASAVNNFAGKTTEVNLQGKTLLPGFVDPHGHFMSALMMTQQVNVAQPPVGNATNIPKIIAALKAYQVENKVEKGGWLVGWGYDQDLIDEKRHITKLDLDGAFPDHKVLIIHVSMHGAVLNSQALKWANIDANTKTPEGGIIARLPNSNEPAGLVMEMSYIPIMDKMPQPSEEKMLELMAKAQAQYTSNGYTHAVEGFTHTKDIDFLMKAAEQNKLVIDIASLPAFTEMDQWFNNPKYKFGEYNNKFKIHACKITLDGSPQGKTALVSKPYLTGGPAGEKDWYGNASISQEQLDAITKKMFDANIPLQIHANGDGAIDMMVKTVENAGITAEDDRRTVIVHSQFQRPEHLPKYVELGLLPSYFTLHTFFWGDVHIKNIGKKQADFISPMKAAKEHGIITSNHSDFNVTPLNPFFIMWSSMARETRSGDILGADQRVDAYTALQALTTGPAYQFFEENRKGMIKKGLLADFVVLENNPLKQGVDSIKNNRVVSTIKEGKVVYSASKLVGANSDSKGCKASAGYQWCNSTNQCERPWQLAKEYSFANAPISFNHFCKND